MRHFLSVLPLLIFSLLVNGQAIQPAGPTTFCSGGSVVLTVDPTTGLTGYQWIKDGTDIPAATNAAYTVNVTGSYTVRIGRTALSDTTIGPVGVVVNPLPTIIVNSPNICIGQSGTLTASGATTYSWSPATGLSATTGAVVTANPSITSTYTVTGTNTATGCINTAISTVTVNPLPVADFTFSPSGQCSGIPVTFTNTSTGGSTYSWNFGDPNSGANNASALQNPVHKFVGTPGNGNQNFSITLTTTSAAGCISTKTLILTNRQSPDLTLGGTGKITYNGAVYFTTCGVTSGNFTFTNQSTGSTNTSYTIVWGDGSPNFTATSFTSTTHTYSVGPHNMLYIVTGTSGCVDTGKYIAFVGTNPGVGLENPGNTTTCSGESLTFPITGTGGNAPGTLYTVTFNDGSPAITYIHPNVPSSITHVFTNSSCGTTSSNGTTVYTNSFSASIVASNPCLSSAATVVPILVSKKPVASFNTPRDTVCTNTAVVFTNTSQNNYVNNGNCLVGNAVWSITPATGWSINSGSLGNDFGSTDPSVWQNGTNTLSLSFSVGGIYTIKIKSGSTKECGTDDTVRTICVTAPPAPAFTLNTITGCSPLTVNATNTTNSFSGCQNPTYLWTVTYASGFCGISSSWSFANGTNATSANPSIIFINPGTYTLRLQATNACGNFITTQTITVKKPPVVTVNPPVYPCGPVTITPVANVAACGTGTITYLWTFDGGTPATASTLNPGAVTFTTQGNHLITLAVTNECGTTSGTQTITVTAAPDVNQPPNQSLCGGVTTAPVVFTSNIPPLSYRWVNNTPSIGLAANGIGNIPSFTAANASAAPVTATITVTPFINTNCTGIPVTFTITVNPRPTAPVVTPIFIYCQNITALPLTATAGGGNTLTWYTSLPLSGGSATAPTPSTTVPGTTNYYVTQTNSFTCESAPAIITISVRPTITGNTITADQNICAGTAPALLSGSGIPAGGTGSFTYQWQFSTDGGTTWANVTGGANATYQPPSLTGTTTYRRIVSSTPCADTSNLVTITVQGALTNYDITASQTICQGLVPDTLRGQQPTGGGAGYTYLWESSINNIAWVTTGITTLDFQPPALNQTTYYRRRVIASQCSAISNTITIAVNSKPLGIISTVNSAICEYEAASVLFTASTGTPPFNVELTVTRPNGTDSTITATIPGTGPVNIAVITANSATGTYTIVLKKITDAKGCINEGAPISTISIIVKPRPVLGLNTPPSICNGTSTTLTVTGAATYSWTPATGLSSTTASTVIANPTITTTYTVTGTQNGCASSASVIVTVTPGTTIANAGPGQIICSNITTTTLAANAAVTGTGSWSQVSGPAAAITNSALNNTNVTGLTAGERYVFQWTITGLPPCPATNSNVIIDVLSALVNVIRNDTIICIGQAVLLQTQSLSGGNTTLITAQYTYQWESSNTAQNTWTAITGATQATLTVTPAASTCYRRKVRSNGSCESTSNAICVTVNPSINNNIITASQQVCVNIVPANLTGLIPTGGDNNYVYQWQTSTDAINWTNISSAVNFQPAAYPLAGVHYFRRNVSSGNCTSASNAIIVTVRPNSKAIFAAGKLIDCSPFNLASVITVTPLPDSNDLYQWYADGVLIGSNSTGIFPGYTILNQDDTVVIKLRTTSRYGCLPDSMQLQFITVVTAIARFTKDTSAGCGPLPVRFTNTSSILNSSIQYFWNFGNGITSTALQPPVVTFNSSPFFNDTVYRVTLKVYNGCDTTIWRDSVRIRANPKARFGVDTTFGCSPFTVQIDNNSAGGPNTYYWDFGNGDRDTTFANGIFNYTYNIGNAVDTFTIRLIAANQCRRDTQTIDVRVAPNIIRPLINVNSSQLFGCTPHIVSFNNNTSGATGYTWNFGDNSPLVITNNNQTTVVHTYTTPGVFNVAIDITNGCSDTTVYRQVTVYAKPVASFTTTTAAYCVGDTVRVINTSQNATNYRWFWGDGGASAGTIPTHVYTAAGSYNILLWAERTNSSGIVCFDTLVRPITVLAKPVVTVQSNVNAINCAPFTLNVTAPGILNEAVTWYFSDSTVTPSLVTATGAAAQYTFTKPGTFSVKMIAINAAGCRDSTTINFTVRGRAVASFTPGNLAVCTRDTTVSYINNTTYNGTDPISYRWLVDNTQLSVNPNFTHRYTVVPLAALPRTFNTWLIVTNTVGCSDTARATFEIKPTARARFSISNPNDCVPYAPNIINASTDATSYKWLLNGVELSTAATPSIPIIRGSTAYTITLIADNIYGCKPDTFAITFTSRARPVAAFKLSDTLGCTGVLNVATTNLTTGASSYTWNWGDASANSFFTNPTHLYNTPGQYLITLVASDGVCTDTTGQLVRVSTKPVVNFVPDQTLTCDSARIQFTNLSGGGATYEWSFGDGTSSTVTNPFKVYAPRLAPYTVKLVATSTFGCKDSAVKANLILAKLLPASDFFISPNPVITVPNYTFNFNNLTINSASYKYLWSLADGTFASTRDVTHKYRDTGNYAVRLIVLDTITNCTDTTIKIARVDGFPGYLYVPNAICPTCIQSSLREFLPKGVGLKEYRLQIVTTWGELIFETTALDSKGAPSQFWDGKFKGTVVQQDAYLWRIDAKFLNGSEWLGMIYPGESKYKKAGTITVVK